MEQNTNTTIFSTGAIEFSRFVFSLYSGKGREFLRYAALAAYEALGDGNQFARLQDYSGITGSVNNEMRFHVGYPHMSLYETPMGALTVEIVTEKLAHRLSERGGILDIKYTIAVEQQVTGRHQFKIRVRESMR